MKREPVFLSNENTFTSFDLILLRCYQINYKDTGSLMCSSDCHCLLFVRTQNINGPQREAWSWNVSKDQLTQTMLKFSKNNCSSRNVCINAEPCQWQQPVCSLPIGFPHCLRVMSEVISDPNILGSLNSELARIILHQFGLYFHYPTTVLLNY